RTTELASLKDNLQLYFDLFGKWWLLAVGAALALAGDRRATMRAVVHGVRYWAPAATGLLLYLFGNDLLVQWKPTPQPPARYVGIFVLLFCLMTAFSLRFRTKVIRPIAARSLAVLLVVASGACLATATRALRIEWNQPPATTPWQVTRGLQD